LFKTTVTSSALVVLALMTAGCAGTAINPAASGDTNPSATTAVSGLVSPDAATICEGVALDFARGIGPDAQLYSGSIVSESALAEQTGTSDSTGGLSTEPFTLCFYTDVPTAPSVPPRSDGEDVAYTVLGVKVGDGGTAEVYSMGPTGSETNNVPADAE
jgi:hypothetical protein